ncbi:monovalent cation/H+ antiporter subunit A [Thermaurantiacus sp.]
MDVVLPLLVLLPFLAIPLVLLVHPGGRQAVTVVAGAALGLGFLLLVARAPDVFAAEVAITIWPWLPALGLDFGFRLDGLGFLFAGLIYGIGVLIIVYAYYYMPKTDGLVRFLATLLAFAGAMLGIVLAENILLLFLFWEVTSLTSFLLIAYKYKYNDSRIAARMALAITGAGGLAMLAGFLLLGRIAGSYELTHILDRGDLIRSHPLYLPMLALVLVGAFTKSAQVPFHLWLPNAMAAPTPVSAYLHSATMVKAGVFLLARLYPALSGTEPWFVAVTGVGMATLLLGAYLALLKHDFKGLLAFSTVSHLGLITTLFGLGTPMSAVAATFHIINHAIFKASLFMVAGVIDIQCGTRDMRRVNGLAKYMPVTALLGITAAGAMAGVPFLNGFLSKEMFFAETVAHPGFEGVGAYLLPAVATLAGILSVAYSARFVHDVFFNGEPVDLPKTPAPPPAFMQVPMAILVALVVIVGVAPQLAVRDLLLAASAAVLQGPVPPVKLAVWHGFNAALVMSIIALGGGIFWYWRRDHLFTLHERIALDFASPVAIERLYDALTAGARLLRAHLAPRALAGHAGLVVAAALVLGGAALGPALPGPLPLGPVDGMSLLGGLMLLVGVGAVLFWHRERVAAIIAMSVIGLVVSLAFVRFAAPDLALTQLSVEVVTILLLLLALRFLPQREEPATGGGAARLVLALGAGLGMAALAFLLLTRPFETISGWHIAEAKPGGGGTNVVNVILVDFRGFDTLGEIAVLAMAGLGAHALLQGLVLLPQVPRAGHDRDRWPVMLRMAMQPMLPLALTGALYIFLRGHNLPGGGFISGLLVAVALVLQYLAGGLAFAEARLRVDFVRLIAAGLLLSVATGLASLAFGAPFLTSTYGYVTTGVLEPFELASAMVFDLGILLVVVGTVLLALTEIGQILEAPAPARARVLEPA